VISHDLDDSSVIYCYLNLASANLLSGDLDEAKAAYFDALRGAQRAGDQFIVANSLLGFALCRSAEGADAEAAELHGVTDGVLAQLGAVLEVGEAKLRGEDHDRLRTRMGATRFEAAYGTGLSLPVADGVARAVATSAQPERTGITKGDS
jgi:hypothetical protein